jgi:hypothetical protein
VIGTLFVEFLALGNKFDFMHLATEVKHEHATKQTNKHFLMCQSSCHCSLFPISEGPFPLPPSYSEVMEERRKAKMTDGQVGRFTQQSSTTFISHPIHEHALFSEDLISQCRATVHDFKHKGTNNIYHSAHSFLNSHSTPIK